MSILNKLKKNLMSPNELYYLKKRKELLKKQTILLECTHGREVSGHIYSLAENIITNFPQFTIHIAVRKNVEVQAEFQQYVVEHMGKKYLELLATSEYLINDTSFWEFFNKREEQQYFIFWHGTPLKFLGKSTQVQGYGNVQRNLAAANKIFVSNKFTKDCLIKEFGIENIIDNQIIVGPSPRNSYLFENKVVNGRYLYMPTWRGVNVAKANVSNEMLDELKEIDQLLNENEEMYVKLHPYEAELLNFSEQQFKHLKEYPKEVELYHFLQTVEKLITDYSSIMFDFILTNRPIILFPFDEERYIDERGMYQKLEDLPFQQGKSAKEIATLLHQADEVDYSEIQSQYTKYDTSDGTEKILRYLFNKQKSSSILEYNNWNGKENILIYVYQLADNGITASLLNLVNNIDLEKRNYIFIWQDGMIPKKLEYKIKQLPEHVYTFIQAGKVQASSIELIHTLMYMNQLPANKELIYRMYQRDFQRTFPNMKVSRFIHYPGYDRSYAVWISALKSLNIKTNIFVHTDMEQEFEINPSLKPKVLFQAYRDADTVICVSKPTEEKIKNLVPETNTRVMEVLINIEKIKKLSLLPMDDKVPERLRQDFENDDITVFISVGRFSKQKGFDRLITAFENLNRVDIRLAIIASYGPEKANLYDQVKNSPSAPQIYLLDEIPQPYQLMKAADCFVFSSRYEGLGMVVFESLAVDTPVIMTDILETVSVLGGKDKTMVVSNSMEGLLEGMEVFLNKAPQLEKYDFNEHTLKSLATWENVIK